MSCGCTIYPSAALRRIVTDVALLFSSLTVLYCIQFWNLFIALNNSILVHLEGLTRWIESPPFFKVVDIVAKLLLSEILRSQTCLAVSTWWHRLDQRAYTLTLLVLSSGTERSRLMTRTPHTLLGNGDCRVCSLSLFNTLFALPTAPIQNGYDGRPLPVTHRQPWRSDLRTGA